MLQVVWAITFIGVIILGIIAGRKVKNIQEWALGGRNLTWIDVGCILAAFQMGGTTIIGVAQNGFKIGYAGAWYSITGTIAMLCMLLVVKPLRRRTNGDSLMSFMSDRYSPAVAKFYSYSYLLMGFFYIPIQLFTLCTVIQLVIPNSSLAVAAVIGLVLAVSYSALSGIEGAKVVGKLTCLFAYIFIAVGTFLIVSKAGGWADIKAVAPADHFSMANMPLNTIIGWIISSICGFMTMQAALQPTLAAKDDSHAVKGAIAGAIFSLPMGFLTATIGIVACVKLPEIDSSAAFVETVNTFLPQLAHRHYPGHGRFDYRNHSVGTGSGCRHHYEEYLCQRNQQERRAQESAGCFQNPHFCFRNAVHDPHLCNQQVYIVQCVHGGCYMRYRSDDLLCGMRTVLEEGYQAGRTLVNDRRHRCGYCLDRCRSQWQAECMLPHSDYFLPGRLYRFQGNQQGDS